MTQEEHGGTRYKLIRRRLFPKLKRCQGGSFALVFHKEQVTTGTVTTREQAEQHLLGTYHL